MDFQPEYRSSLPAGEQLWLLFSPGEREIFLPPSETLPFFRSAGVPPGADRALMMGRSFGTPVCCAVLAAEEAPPEGAVPREFREFYRDLPRFLQFPLSRGRQLLNWDRTHRFCGACGEPTRRLEEEPARRCPRCGELFYPRLSPAVIVRITRGDRIMLAHNKNFPEGVFSHIAGFVEAGENLEQALRREVREEVGLELEDIRFFGAQPWPMPHSLMTAFTARCPEGDPRPDGREILDARWFDREALPGMPAPGSIAWDMIRDYLDTPPV